MSDETRASKFLKPCPNSPNCVVSLYPRDKEHYSKPWQATSDVTAVCEALLELAQNSRQVEVVHRSENYLHFTFRIPVLGFIDDVEFYVSGHPAKIFFRSASRVGHHDLGVNRRRIKRIHKYLNARSLL